MEEVGQPGGASKEIVMRSGRSSSHLHFSLAIGKLSA